MTSPNGLRAALYTRISTDETNQPHSLGAQKRSLETFARSQGWTVVETYKDMASGATLDRPDLQRALSDAKQGQFDVLVVYRLDRLVRSQRLIWDVLEEFESYGVLFRSMSEHIDTTHPMGRLVTGIIAGFGGFEREIMIDRIKQGISSKAAKGYWVGGQAAFGYVMSSETKNLEVVPDEADLVRVIYRKYLDEGVGLKTIAGWLNDQGFRTKLGNAWSTTAVARVLRSPTYAGLVRVDGIPTRGLHEPIVDELDWARAQDILDERGERGTRSPDYSTYILTGLMRCPTCGGAYVGCSTRKPSGDKYRYYCCTHKAKKGAGVCDSPNLPAEAIEALVKANILQAFESTALFQDAWERDCSATTEQTNNLPKEIQHAKKALATVRRKKDRYYEAFEAESLDSAELRDRLAKLNADEGQIAGRLSDLESQLTAADSPPPPDRHELAHLRDRVAEALDQEGTPALRAFIRSVVEKVRIRSDLSGTLVLRVPTATAPTSDKSLVRTAEPLVEVSGPGPPASPLRTSRAVPGHCVLARGSSPVEGLPGGRRPYRDVATPETPETNVRPGCWTGR